MKPLLYFDFLGFSEKILNQDLQKSYDFYYREIIKELEIVSQKHEYNFNYSIVSDSVMIYCGQKDFRTSVYQLVELASVYFHNFIFSNIPVRGSIVFDEFMIENRNIKMWDRNIQVPVILGKAIVNASRWEKEQKWMGISIPPSYISNADASLKCIFQTLIDNKFLIEYDVPIKSGYKKTLAISGLPRENFTGIRNSKQRTVTYFEKINYLKKDIDNPEYLTKINNTEKYLNFIMSNELYVSEH